jgi:hypothetical protein
MARRVGLSLFLKSDYGGVMKAPIGRRNLVPATIVVRMQEKMALIPGGDGRTIRAVRADTIRAILARPRHL